MDLWMNDLYINRNIPYLFNTHIYEYDIKSAGLSLIKEYNLLDKLEINKLENLDKPRQVVRIGLLQKNNKELLDNLKESFKKARKLFFDANGLTDSDIISIKKDAIFTTKRCEINKVTENIDFREKNMYTSFILLNSKIELYYSDNKLDIKGLSEENINYHKNYMIDFINKFFYKMENDSIDHVLLFMKRFIDKYKRRELDIGYYRSFDFHSRYIETGDINIEFMEYPNSRKEFVDITYNFQNVLLKLISIPLS